MAFKDIIGQERAIGLLTKAIASGRVASAYLFAGDSGIGKRLTALNFAKALNCASPIDGGPCDACPSCKKIDAGMHPDLFMIAPEKGTIKVEVIRNLNEAVSLSSLEGGTKIVIIDEAETLHPSAANAFLKTLEEPPPACVIILVSASPEGLLETIRSRCVRVNFRPLSPENCLKVLRPKLGADAETAARLSMGRPGAALEADLVKEREWAIGVFSEILKPGGRALFKDKEDMQRWFDAMLVLLRDMAVRAVSGGELAINRDMEGAIGRMSGGADIKVIIDCYGKLRGLRAALRFNLNKGITWNYAGGVLRQSGIRGI